MSSWNPPWPVLPLFVGLALLRLAYVHAWRQRGIPIARSLGLLFVSVSAWMLADAGYLLASRFDHKLLFSKLAYLGIATTPPAVLLVGLQATRRLVSPSVGLAALLLVEPLAVVAIAFTNQHHGFLWREVRPVPGTSALRMSYGPFFWGHVSYAYVLLFASTVLICSRYARSWPEHRREARIVVPSIAAPWLANAAYIAGWEVAPGIDLTQYGFALTAFGLTRGLLGDFFDVRWEGRSGIIDGMSDAVIVLDSKGEALDWNLAARRVLALPAAPEPSGRTRAAVAETFRDLEAGRREVSLASEGGERVFELEASPLLSSGNGSPHRVVVLRDVTERKRAEKRIRTLAYYDSLTGLPNRQTLLRRVTRATRAASRRGERVALLFVDIDDFKMVNDTLGHPAGDELLRQVAARFADGVRCTDVVSRAEAQREAEVARLGGDEFTVLLTDLREGHAAGRVARRLLDTLAEPFRILDHEIFVNASIGISIFPDDASDTDELLRNADSAMYESKRRGVNSFQFYTESMYRAHRRRLQLEGCLRRALEREELQLFYQPQRGARFGELRGAEVLLRWSSPELGSVSPGEFVPVAEAMGLIGELGEWVLRRACVQAVDWRTRGFRPIRLAVNLSAHQIRQANLVEKVVAILRETGFPAAQLELELTESAIVHHDEGTLATLGALAGMGLSLALDDFGTGYSSLSNLRLFPIDRVKIDRSFVNKVPADPDDSALTEAIVAMAHGLRLGVIAEGVETEAQLAFLRERGCDELQGYLLSPPVSALDFERFLEREKREEL